MGWWGVSSDDNDATQDLIAQFQDQKERQHSVKLDELSRPVYSQGDSYRLVQWAFSQIDFKTADWENSRSVFVGVLLHILQSGRKVKTKYLKVGLEFHQQLLKNAQTKLAGWKKGSQRKKRESAIRKEIRILQAT